MQLLIPLAADRADSTVWVLAFLSVLRSESDRLFFSDGADDPRDGKQDVDGHGGSPSLICRGCARHRWVVFENSPTEFYFLLPGHWLASFVHICSGRGQGDGHALIWSLGPGENRRNRYRLTGGTSSRWEYWLILALWTTSGRARSRHTGHGAIHLEQQRNFTLHSLQLTLGARRTVLPRALSIAVVPWLMVLADGIYAVP